MNKCYYRIVWENYPSDKTPVNEQNLNKIDVATDEMDNRIISLDSTKFDKAEAQLLVKYIEYDEDTGIFKITHYNGASYTIDTLLEKLAINFDYDYQTQRLIIELSDGEIKYVDLSALIKQYDFVDSGTIAYTIHPDGRVISEVKEGSIEEKHLRPDYLADIRVEAAKAESGASVAGNKATEASGHADLSRSYATGTGGEVRENDDSDCAEYYYEQTKRISQSISGVVPMGTIDFAGLNNPDNQKDGYLFNISDSFVSDERFADGGGIFYGAGNNVLYTADGMWDVLAASMVSGVKGYAETEYRQGFVDLTAQNIGAIPSSAIINNDTTSDSGYVADARIVKMHGDEIDALKAANSALNDSLTNALEAHASDITYDDINSQVKIVTWSFKKIRNIIKIYMYFTVTGTLPSNWHICLLPVRPSGGSFFAITDHTGTVHMGNIEKNGYLHTVGALPEGNYVIDTIVLL